MHNIVFDADSNNFLLIDFENSLRICHSECQGLDHECGNAKVDFDSFGKMLEKITAEFYKDVYSFLFSFLSTFYDVSREKVEIKANTTISDMLNFIDT